MKLISLFTGIGAFEEALKQSNEKFDVILASDNGERYLSINQEEIDEKIKNLKNNKEKFKYIDTLYEKEKKPNFVKETYILNNSEFSGEWYQDVRFINGKEYYKKADILVGGSPCQAFSTYGRRKGIEDARGTLFYEYIRMVQESQPKTFIYENVRGLLTIDNGETFRRSIEMFESIGYKVKWKVLNAVDYGLPQLRKRVFVVGVREDIDFDFEFPQKIPLKLSVSDFYTKEKIDAKYYLTEKGFNYVTTKNINKGRAKSDSKIMNCQTATQQFNWTGEFKTEIFQNYQLSNKRLFVSPDNMVARKLIPSETVALMGFKNFIFPDIPDVQKWRQSGNSIAVPVLKLILKNLRGAYEE